MELYWRESNRRQMLMLSPGEGADEETIGGVRETKQGYDAFAKTFGYDPGRAQKGLPSLEAAKKFVELFKPWELYPGTEGLSVDPEARPSSA